MTNRNPRLDPDGDDEVDTAQLAANAVTAAKLASGAVDAIGDIDAAVRAGADTTLLTGTAGTDGNVPQFNADGDLVDSAKAASSIGSGGSGGSARAEAESGYVAYQLAGGSVQTFDPTADTTLDQTIQRAVNQAETNQSYATAIWIPHTDKNGTELEIASQVTFGSNGDTYPTFAGNTGRNGPYIDVSITNGDAALYLDNIRFSGANIWGANADGLGNDCEFIRFYDCDAPRYYGGNLRAFCGPSPATAAGAIVVDSTSYNGYVVGVNFNGIPVGGTTDVSGMNCIGAADTDNTGSSEPGEWGIGFCSNYADPSFPIHSVIADNGVNFRNVRIFANRLEGAGGDGLVDFTSGYPLIMGNQLGRTENTAHRLNVTGFAGWIGPNMHSASCGGDAVRVNVAQGVVNNSGRYSNPGGVCIHARTSDTLQVPNRNAVVPSTAGVDYPSGGSTGVYENDATQL